MDKMVYSHHFHGIFGKDQPREVGGTLFSDKPGIFIVRDIDSRSKLWSPGLGVVSKWLFLFDHVISSSFYLAIEMFVTDPFQVIGSVPLNSLLTIVILSLNIAICRFFAVFPTVYPIPIIPDTATWVTWAGATGREISWKSLRKSVNVWPSFTGEERDILAFLASQW